jgi:hypothetical protein
VHFQAVALQISTCRRGSTSSQSRFPSFNSRSPSFHYSSPSSPPAFILYRYTRSTTKTVLPVNVNVYPFPPLLRTSTLPAPIWSFSL